MILVPKVMHIDDIRSLVCFEFKLDSSDVFNFDSDIVNIQCSKKANVSFLYYLRLENCETKVIYFLSILSIVVFG